MDASLLSTCECVFGRAGIKVHEWIKIANNISDDLLKLGPIFFLHSTNKLDAKMRLRKCVCICMRKQMEIKLVMEGKRKSE